MRDVAVVSFAQWPQERRHEGSPNGIEMLVPVMTEAVEESGLTRDEIGFWCSGSSDYIAGRAFSFVMAVDAIGAWPPINESHLEMDAAWALYEAWVKIQTGEVDTALVYGFGKSSAGDLRRILCLQLDPYYVAPLWPDSIGLAALQARAAIEAGCFGEADMAEVVARSLADAAGNPNALRGGERGVDDLLAEPYFSSPLRRHDCPPVTDGAAAIVIAADDVARRVCSRPAWIRAFEHRVDTQNLGVRDLTRSDSAAGAAAAAGVPADGIDVAEIHAPFSSQELILRQSMGLADSVRVNPSGGALAGNPMFAAGLTRIGEAATAVHQGRADRALGHATSGPCLQQNLVCVLEGD
jgi:acetyl-CoA acetyltransferase